MAAQRHWIAFDIGTTGLKAALITPHGQPLRTTYRTYPTQTADHGLMEQDANDWWQAARAAAQELKPPQGIDAIAVTGQMQDLILIDGRGNPIRPVILYSDTRAREEAASINRRIGAAQLRELTGNDQDAGGLLAKLVWLNRHEPQTLTRTEHLLLGAADYITYKLTGVAINDTTTASTTGLMDIQKRNALDVDIFSQLDISYCRKYIPLMHPGGKQIGKLHADAGKQLNLKPGIPVYHGPGDAGAATIGAGSGEPGSAYAYIGTSGWVAFTANERANPESGAITLAHPRSDYYIQIAPLLTAGGNLEWIRKLFDDDDYGQLIDEALKRTPTNLLYMPYLNGERSPFRDPLARGAFIGLTSQMERPDLYRAVLEGVVYAYRHALDALLPTPATSLTLTGGGTRSQAWCQLFADIIDLPVHIAADAEHVGLRGAVIAAQVASGVLDTYNPPDRFPVRVTLQPSAAQRQHFNQQYRLFLGLYPSLSGVFANMG